MKDDLLEYFAPMLRARRFDEALCEHGELVNDTYHVSIGLETSAVAMTSATRPGDSMLLNHRNHGHLAASGSDLEMMYREIFGRDGGPHRGRLGSFHLTDVERGIPYVSAMLAGGVPLAIGIGLANSRLGKDSVAIAYLGDGAMEEGIVYESFNIASMWGVSVVIVCDNNGSRASLHGSKFCDLARVCGLEAVSVDAQRPLSVFSKVEDVVEAARRGSGPKFIEIFSEPWPGNSTGNHPRNVTGRFDVASAPARTDPWSVADPLVHLIREIMSQGVAMRSLLEVDARISTEVRQAVAAAIGAPIAPTAAIYQHVWGEDD